MSKSSNLERAWVYANVAFAIAYLGIAAEYIIAWLHFHSALMKHLH